MVQALKGQWNKSCKAGAPKRREWMWNTAQETFMTDVLIDGWMPCSRGCTGFPSSFTTFSTSYRGTLGLPSNRLETVVSQLQHSLQQLRSGGYVESAYRVVAGDTLPKSHHLPPCSGAKCRDAEVAKFRTVRACHKMGRVSSRVPGLPGDPPCRSWNLRKTVWTDISKHRCSHVTAAIENGCIEPVRQDMSKHVKTLYVAAYVRHASIYA